MDVDRAYLYFFNDKDEPQLHGASGITRNFKPKPSFHAMSHLYYSLGEYRFSRAVARKDGDLYCFEYQHGSRANDRVYVAWLATGEQKPARRTLALGAASAGVYRAERMPMTADGSGEVGWKATALGVDVEVGGSPVFLWSR